MDRRTFLKAVPVAAAMVMSTAETVPSQTTELKPIELVKPEMDGGKSVLASLLVRQTNRNIKPDPLTPQEMSNLMWAAFGINRKQLRGKTGRTAASASNSQEIDLYVALPEGVYVYDAAAHKLIPVVAGDFRARSNRRGAAATAPVNIFFVVDLAKYASAPFQEPGLKDPEIQKSYYFVDTGLIAGNIYLYAASIGLAAWFHNCDKENTHKEFNLRPEQRVLFAQTVGHPA